MEPDLHTTQAGTGILEGRRPCRRNSRDADTLTLLRGSWARMQLLRPALAPIWAAVGGGRRGPLWRLIRGGEAVLSGFELGGASG